MEIAAKRVKAPRLTISVSEAVVEHSKQRDSSHCMIAEAVRESAPYAASISVDLQTVRFSDPEKGLRYTYLTPRKAQEALIDFDQGIQPAEFEFQLTRGQVTVMATRRNSGAAPREKPRTAKQKANDERLARFAKKTFVNQDSGVAYPTGGRTPPVSSFARRRAFGLRALRY